MKRLPHFCQKVIFPDITQQNNDTRNIAEQFKMIPKKIHYIWLSDEPFPPLQKKCLDSWRKQLPDYEIIHWDMEKCRKIIDTVPFVRDAISKSKWAFASDYIRLYAIYTEGGIYLDSDVCIYASFDKFLENQFFTNIEYTVHFKKNKSHLLLNEDGTKKDPSSIPVPGLALQAAIFGAEAGHPFLKKCMDYYENTEFILPDGTLNMNLISPFIYAHIAQDYGFRYKDKMQRLENGMAIYPSNVFLPSCNPSRTKPYAIHVTNGSWRPFLQKLTRLIKKLPRRPIEKQLDDYTKKPLVDLPE